MSDEPKIFRIIYRINLVLFLIVMAYGAFLVVESLLPSDDPPPRGTVEVAEDPTQDESPTVELRFGDLRTIRGSDTRFTELETQATGEKFSSYTPSETRNLLFISDPEFDSHWLFDHHRFRLINHSVLNVDKEIDEERPAVALYLDLVKEDSNSDGILSEDDLHTIALLDTSGHNYTEVLRSIEQIVSSDVHPDGSALDILVRNGNELVLKRFSLASFELLSEKVVAVLQ